MVGVNYTEQGPEVLEDIKTSPGGIGFMTSKESQSSAASVCLGNSHDITQTQSQRHSSSLHVSNMVPQDIMEELRSINRCSFRNTKNEQILYRLIYLGHTAWLLFLRLQLSYLQEAQGNSSTLINFNTSLVLKAECIRELP